MTEVFPPLEGRELGLWAVNIVLGLIVVTQVSWKPLVALGGFAVGFCLLHAYVHWRYESIEFRTAVEEVDA